MVCNLTQNKMSGRILLFVRSVHMLNRARALFLRRHFNGGSLATSVQAFFPQRLPSFYLIACFPNDGPLQFLIEGSLTFNSGQARLIREQKINLFKRYSGCLWVKQPNNHRITDIENGKDDVSVS